MRRRLRQPREDLQRPGEVELRQLREDEEADVEGGHLVPSSGLKCASDSVPDAAMGQFLDPNFRRPPIRTIRNPVARLGRGLLKAGPRVRIRLPPAESQAKRRTGD